MRCSSASRSPRPYPILQAVEVWRGYDGLFVQRSRGETKKSLLLLFFSHAILITLFAGLAGKPYIVWASVLMWGVGDTFAALIAAPVASATELYSHGGNDTVTVAGVTAVLLLGLSFIL